MGLMPLAAATSQTHWNSDQRLTGRKESRNTHLALVCGETAVEAVEALVAVVGLRDRGSWRRFETPASLVPLNEELDLAYFELLEKLCFMEFEVDLNILAGLSLS